MFLVMRWRFGTQGRILYCIFAQDAIRLAMGNTSKATTEADRVVISEMGLGALSLQPQHTLGSQRISHRDRLWLGGT